MSVVEALAPYGSLIVYALTAVAAVATIKAAAVSLKERLDKHEDQDLKTHEKMFASLGKQDVMLARLDEKMDHVRKELQELRK